MNLVAKAFGGLISKMRYLKLVLHIVSGTTQFYNLKLIAESQLEGIDFVNAILVSLILAAVVASVIEFGIGNLFPYWIRGIVRGIWFKDTYSIALFVMLSFIVLPLVVASPLLSYYGGQYIIDNNTTKTKKRDKSKVKQFAANEKTKINKQKSKDKAEIKSKYKNSRYAVSKSYKPKIKAQQARINRGVNEGNNGLKNKAINKKRKLEAERDGKIAKLTEQEIEELAAIDKSSRASIEIIETGLVEDKKDIKDANDEDSTARAEFVRLWGGFLGYVAGFASLGIIFIYTMEEVYHAATGSKYEEFVFKNDTSEITAWASEWGDKFAMVFVGWIDGLLLVLFALLSLPNRGLKLIVNKIGAPETYNLSPSQSQRHKPPRPKAKTPKASTQKSAPPKPKTSTPAPKPEPPKPITPVANNEPSIPIDLDIKPRQQSPDSIIEEQEPKEPETKERAYNNVLLKSMQRTESEELKKYETAIDVMEYQQLYKNILNWGIRKDKPNPDNQHPDNLKRWMKARRINSIKYFIAKYRMQNEFNKTVSIEDSKVIVA